MQTSATQRGEAWEESRGPGALASWNQVTEAAGGRKRGPRASAPPSATSAWAPSALPLSRRPLALGPAAQGPRLVVVGASGLQPRWGPGARAWRRGRSNERLGESREEALIPALRWRLRESRRVNPVEGECGRRGAWERMARSRVKSRAPGRPRSAAACGAPARILPRPPPLAGPCGVQTLPGQAPDAAAREPGVPASASGEGCGGGNPDTNGDFLIYFSQGNLSLWLGLPIYFPLTSCWRSSSEGARGGAGGGRARAQGGMETVERI